ncbi:hypothetical protein TNCT6_00190 [Streptomyces sp. 6-11-2]|nr:hypothetical protein TNCT6_00190 [Streptomyces sp. 6-11-2]
MAYMAATYTRGTRIRDRPDERGRERTGPDRNGPDRTGKAGASRLSRFCHQVTLESQVLLPHFSRVLRNTASQWRGASHGDAARHVGPVREDRRGKVSPQ